TREAPGTWRHIAKEARDERHATKGTTSRAEPAIVSAERRTWGHGSVERIGRVASARGGGWIAPPASNAPDRARDHLVSGEPVVRPLFRLCAAGADGRLR